MTSIRLSVRKNNAKINSIHPMSETDRDVYTKEHIQYINIVITVHKEKRVIINPRI